METLSSNPVIQSFGQYCLIKTCGIKYRTWYADMLHRLASLKPRELRVDMQIFIAEKAYAIYSNFSVADEVSKYKLNVKGYNGNAGIHCRIKKTHRWWNQLMIIGTCIIWHCIENVIFIYSENLNSYHELCPKTYFHFKFESRQ